jgi:hypothetical protein
MLFQKTKYSSIRMGKYSKCNDFSHIKIEVWGYFLLIYRIFRIFWKFGGFSYAGQL